MTEQEIRAALEGARNPEELKRTWLRIVRECHPDKGGSVELCQAANALYERLASDASRFSRFRNTESAPETETETAGEGLPEETRNKAFRFAGIPGLEIEIIGTWLWITGETRANKDALKAEGFRWSPKKSAWYFHAEPYRKRHRGDFTLDDVRALHGSERFNARRMELA